MRKIPTIFERDLSKSASGGLVVKGEPLVDLTGAVPTMKRDGMCVMVREGKLFKRHETYDKAKSPHFELVEADETTGKAFGWLPVGEGPEDKWFRSIPIPVDDGTYEFVGPKSQGNPHKFQKHLFIKHGDEELDRSVPTDFASICGYLFMHEDMEGIVWWRAGQPIGKIKRRDFGLKWPAPNGG